MDIKLSFHGAARNVTGSCYLLQVSGMNLMIDCGLYQEHDLKARNWERFPISPRKVDAVILTHAHLDHCGRLPRLVRDGFDGPIYCTSATAEIAKIVMEDCGRINEEDAEFKRQRHEREGRKGPFREEPLYTEEDAENVAEHFSCWDNHRPLQLGNGIEVEFIEVGHILGASAVRVTITQGNETRRIVFSGDIGRWNMPLLRDPEKVGEADYLLVESTYGNRDHEETASIPEELAEIVNRTSDAGGNLIIPSFAIERTQELLYFLAQLTKDNKIPRLRIFVDSPMASKVSEIFARYPMLLDTDTIRLARRYRMSNVTLVKSAAESKTINHIRGTVIVIAGSGMCTGGRIKHHLAKNIDRPECTVLFVGYQANNTLGRIILDGAKEVRILGESYPVEAKIERISGFSAHADRNELMRWLDSVKTTPRKVFVTHGESDAADALCQRIITEKGWDAIVPEYQQSVELD
jgi:metallo-beta-lactamase family protein